MQLIVNKEQLNASPDYFLRRAGYGYIRDRRTGHDSYVRRFTTDFYPRLHMYFEERGEQIIFNLHLDQKQASYAGAHTHNADYDGEVVGREIGRLKSFITHNVERVSHDAVEYKKEEKNGWWRRFF